MAEAEDVITDVARHATIHIRRLWIKHRGPNDIPRPLCLPELRQRLDLMIHAVYGRSVPLRVAHVPARPTLLTRLFRRHDVQQSGFAIPRTDGRSIWLPMELPIPPPVVGNGGNVAPEEHEYRNAVAESFRTIALLLAARIARGSAQHVSSAACPRSLALYLILEAQAADETLIAELPGMAQAVRRLRRNCLERRPKIATLPPGCRALEHIVQNILVSEPGEPVAGLPWPPAKEAAEHLEIAAWLLRQEEATHSRLPHTHALHKDCWTCELLPLAPAPVAGSMDTSTEDEPPTPPARSAHMPRSPKERKAEAEEDREDDGMWMMQTAEPLEKAEDPMGMQRPTDRDEETAGEEFADALSELPEARLVSSPTPAKEILLSDDTPDLRSPARSENPETTTAQIHYPEWDYRISGYLHPGATIHLLPAPHGPQAWVDKTLARHRSMLEVIRRRFEMLRADRVRLRRRLDGDEIDIDAYTEARADMRAGLPLPQGLYMEHRRQVRNIAIVLLVDISGSTDSYLGEHRRIIDVEREALLLVAIALQHMGEPFSIQAFSGNGPKGVTITTLKQFREAHSPEVALRIAALEPQHYTRCGAALRHATAELMQQPAEHRLLLLLSDGKPNDVDSYEGRYGVEDTRRAVEEARIQGVHPFCLTIDRQAATYLPTIFGRGQYALLNRPQALPTVLLDWMRRLLAGS